MIARSWKGAVATAGNLGARLLLREADAAGEDPERAVFCPDDDRCLVERDPHVTPHDVHGGDE